MPGALRERNEMFMNEESFEPKDASTKSRRDSLGGLKASSEFKTRPVSARTYGASEAPSPPARSITLYTNDLFSMDHGDVLAGEPSPQPPPLSSPLSPGSRLGTAASFGSGGGNGAGTSPARPGTPSGRVQQQMALNQQKRLQRLQGGVAVSTGSPRLDPSAAATPSSPASSSAPGSPAATPTSNYGTPARTLRSPFASTPGSLPPTPFTDDLPAPRILEHRGSGVARQIFSGPPASLRGSSALPQAAGAPAEPQPEAGMRALALAGEDEDEAASFEKGKGRGGAVRLNAVATDAAQLGDVRTWLMRPGPAEGATRCYITRQRLGDGATKKYPTYALFLSDGDRFLLAARRRKRSKSSNYLVSADAADLARRGPGFCGKVRANFVGTEFAVYGTGVKPSKATGAPGSTPVRDELAVIRYQYNVLGTRGPRKMVAAIPGLDAKGERRVFPHEDDMNSLSERVKRGSERDLDGLVVMRNKPPKWNEQLGAYCLNFNGRVTHASVKNFQLVSDDNLDHIILQFGKVGKDTFIMDFQTPISLLQAFAVCLTSFDNKLACE